MLMSSGGCAASSSGCVTRPRAREIGATGYAGPTQHSLLIGRYVMATAEHREPCDLRGSCTVLGAPGGEIPSGDSTRAAVRHRVRILRHYPRQQTLCRRDCRPLKCHEPTFTLLSETAICRPRGCSLRLCGSIMLSTGGSRLRA